MALAESPLAALLPLAFGELAPGDAAELEVLKQQLTRTTAFPCGDYQDKVLRRRIAVRMRACRVTSYGAYLRVLQHAPGEFDSIVDLLTIRVSRFFRNPDVWHAVRDQVLPALLDSPARCGPLRICSAGCAAGEEPYSVSILLQELAARQPDSPLDYAILGADISPAALRDAARGEYTAFSLADTTPERRQHWFSPGPRFQLRPDARRNVSFATLDLLRDPLPGGMDLILCRNVLIYLVRPLQEQLLRLLLGALAPGGYLVLGKAEAPTGDLARRFAAVAPRQRVFRAR